MIDGRMVSSGSVDLSLLEGSAMLTILVTYRGAESASEVKEGDLQFHNFSCTPEGN
jgi:hypothetical protein